MAATLTTLSAVMKQFYLGPLQDQLNNEIMAFDLFQKEKVDWVIPFHRKPQTLHQDTVDVSSVVRACCYDFPRFLIDFPR